MLDVAMPHINGLELQQALTAQGSELPVIFLTGPGDIPMSVHTIKRGAVDFFIKPVNDSDLIEAIHDAIEKDRIARQARTKLIELEQRLATLTPREREVLSHVVSGKLNQQIAADLGTVEKNHYGSPREFEGEIESAIAGRAGEAGRKVGGYIRTGGLNDVNLERPHNEKQGRN